PDSQDICFVPTGSYAELVGRMRPDAAEPGVITNRDGAVLGRHRGVAHYTVGQGKGLGEASIVAGARQAVLEVDATRRRIVVGPRDAGTRFIRLRDLNWLADEPETFECDVKLR